MRTVGIPTTITVSTISAVPAWRVMWSILWSATLMAPQASRMPAPAPVDLVWAFEDRGITLAHAGGDFGGDGFVVVARRGSALLPGGNVEIVAMLSKRQSIPHGEVVLIELKQDRDHGDLTALDVRLQVVYEAQPFTIPLQF